jgi:hypothetical protein
VTATNSEAAAEKSGATGVWLTAALWAIGVGLQFMAPLLRDRVPLSDDLFIGSFLAPWWLFAQVALLAGVLKLFARRAESWSGTSRILFAVGLAAVLALLEPDLLTQVIADDVPLSQNPMRVALIWSTPLSFYLVPAGLVIWSWAWRDGRLTLSRALGLGLVVIGVLNFPFILWLTHLWELYVKSSGGESVRSVQ